MSEEEAVKQPTKGAGAWVNKNVPRKRLKAAFRRYRRSGGDRSLKSWALNGSGLKPLAEKWLFNKKVN